jgi:hypothetical protein
MKSVIFIILFLCALSFGYPREEVQPFLHGAFSFGFTVGSYYLTKLIFPMDNHPSFKKKYRLMLCAVSGIVPGVAKELLDKKKNKFFNREDMYYNSIGIYAGWNVVLLFEF